MSSYVNQEMLIENILQSKGVKNVSVLINENSINVIAGGISLTNDDILKIKSIFPVPFDVSGGKENRFLQ